MFQTSASVSANISPIERVGLLRLAGDAVEQFDGQAVRLWLGTGAEVGVADGGQRRYRRHLGVRAAIAQPRSVGRTSRYVSK
jgi:hypothetical protein